MKPAYKYRRAEQCPANYDLKRLATLIGLTDIPTDRLMFSDVTVPGLPFMEQSSLRVLG